MSEVMNDLVKKMATLPLDAQISLIVSVRMIKDTYSFAFDKLGWSPVDNTGTPGLRTLDSLLVGMSNDEKRMVFRYLLAKGLLNRVDITKTSWLVRCMAEYCDYMIQPMFEALTKADIPEQFILHCDTDSLNKAVKILVKEAGSDGVIEQQLSWNQKEFGVLKEWRNIHESRIISIANLLKHNTSIFWDTIQESEDSMKNILTHAHASYFDQQKLKVVFTSFISSLQDC